jgi:hypothetical protein
MRLVDSLAQLAEWSVTFELTCCLGSTIESMAESITRLPKLRQVVKPTRLLTYNACIKLLIIEEK